MRIIAIDPGDVTGWAFGRVEGDRLTVTGYDYAPWKEFGYRLWRAQCSDDPFTTIVYEAWRLRVATARSLGGSAIPSIQAVGQLKAAAWWAPIDVTLHAQEPAVKPVIDRQMTAYGRGDYLPESEVDHDRDALRHLWFYALHNLKVDVTKED